jgi:hypothetical protein
MRGLWARLGHEGLLVACDQDPIAEDYYLDLKARLSCPTRFYAAISPTLGGHAA